MNMIPNELIKNFNEWKTHELSKAKEYRSECCKEREIGNRGGSCHTCPFSFYNNEYSIPCKDLTDRQIISVYNLNKEEKSMTKKEEIQQEIEKTQKQLAALQEKLKEAEDEVPDVLPFDTGDELFVVNIDGKVSEFRFTDSKEWDYPMREVHRAFKSKNYAETFAEKTQFIADMLHFKYLYDTDYIPAWETSSEYKWTVTIDHGKYKDGFHHEFIAVYHQDRENFSSVFFSSEKVAEKCADWLNKKYGYTKE